MELTFILNMEVNRLKGDFDYKNNSDKTLEIQLLIVHVQLETYKLTLSRQNSKAIKEATIIDNIEYFFDRKTGAQVKNFIVAKIL